MSDENTQAPAEGVTEQPNPTLTLSLELVEVNGLLEILGQQPYVKVSGLIAKIREQGLAQLSQAA
jgi:hypothetical protein